MNRTVKQNYYWTGRPLVLIAGQGATSSIWGPDLLSSLAQDRPVVIFDTRCLLRLMTTHALELHAALDHVPSNQRIQLGYPMTARSTLTNMSKDCCELYMHDCIAGRSASDSSLPAGE